MKKVLICVTFLVSIFLLSSCVSITGRESSYSNSVFSFAEACSSSISSSISSSTIDKPSCISSLDSSSSSLPIHSSSLNSEASSSIDAVSYSEVPIISIPDSSSSDKQSSKPFVPLTIPDNTYYLRSGTVCLENLFSKEAMLINDFESFYDLLAIMHYETTINTEKRLFDKRIDDFCSFIDGINEDFFVDKYLLFTMPMAVKYNIDNFKLQLITNSNGILNVRYSYIYSDLMYAYVPPSGYLIDAFAIKKEKPFEQLNVVVSYDGEIIAQYEQSLTTTHVEKQKEMNYETLQIIDGYNHLLKDGDKDVGVFFTNYDSLISYKEDMQNLVDNSSLETGIYSRAIISFIETVDLTLFDSYNLLFSKELTIPDSSYSYSLTEVYLVNTSLHLSFYRSTSGSGGAVITYNVFALLLDKDVSFSNLVYSIKDSLFGEIE